MSMDIGKEPPPRWWILRAIATAGSWEAAAKEAGMNTGALRFLVTGMERRFGVPLVEEDEGQLVLTQDARTLLADAQE